MMTTKAVVGHSSLRRGKLQTKEETHQEGAQALEQLGPRVGWDLFQSVEEVERLSGEHVVRGV